MRSATLLAMGVALCSAQRPSVTTGRGLLLGFYQDGNIATFLGVPYAQAPVGPLRFQRPRSLRSWPGTLDAGVYGPACVQKANPAFGDAADARVSEDCLSLNIFTPNLSPFTRLPVMVYIHGGGYTNGDGRMLDGAGIARNLASRDVVVVTIQYRLGVFGFFTTMDPSLPANNGMYDQLEALRWVQEEILNFGGDPDAVTIFGHSAGAFSASLHTISPLSRGLASQAILMSGTYYCPNAVDGNDNKHKTFKKSSRKKPQR